MILTLPTFSSQGSRHRTNLLPWVFNLPHLPPSPALPFLSILEAPYSPLCSVCCGDRIFLPSHPNPHPRLWLQKLEVSSGLLPSVCGFFLAPRILPGSPPGAVSKATENDLSFAPTPVLVALEKGHPFHSIPLSPNVFCWPLGGACLSEREHSGLTSSFISVFQGGGGILTQQAILHLVCSSCLAL